MGKGFIPVYIKRGAGGSVLFRTGGRSVRSCAAEEFSTLFGVFRSEDRGEFGGELTTPSGMKVGGNYRHIFELGGKVYAVSTQAHMILAHTCILRFDSVSDYKCIYSAGGVGIFNEMYRILLEAEIQSVYVLSGIYDDVKDLEGLAARLGLKKYDGGTAEDLLKYFRFLDVDAEYGERLRFFNDSEGRFEDHVMPKARTNLMEALKDSGQTYLEAYALLPKESEFRVLSAAYAEYLNFRDRRLEIERSIRMETCSVISLKRRGVNLAFSWTSRCFFDRLDDALKADDEFISLQGQIKELSALIAQIDDEKDAILDRLIKKSEEEDQRCFEVASRLFLRKRRMRIERQGLTPALWLKQPILIGG